MTTSSWFPIDAVDTAVRTPHGSGRSEKALMTWFAARPTAQARAAVLAALIPDPDATMRALIEIAITGTESTVAGEIVGFEGAVGRIADRVGELFPDGVTMLDPFSGRGIIPLEGSRFGARSIGIDLAPLAVLGSRLLAEYPLRDWSDEPNLPEAWYPVSGDDLLGDQRPKLVRDVEAVLTEVGRRLQAETQGIYPTNPDGTYPWGYLWAVTIPCDACGRRFPLVGSLVLRHPRLQKDDLGQWLRLKATGDAFESIVEDGLPDEEPTFVAVAGRRGRVGRCLFCRHIHSLDVIKQKGFAGEYVDRILVAGENNTGDGPSKLFRGLREDEHEAALVSDDQVPAPIDALSGVPDEAIPPGNNHTVRASAYGYPTYGSLMPGRQALQFATTAAAIEGVRLDSASQGLSSSYADALASYAGAALVRRLRYSTRGARLRPHGSSAGMKPNTVQTHDIYADESKVSDGFDFFEAGPGSGPGTWASICATELTALHKAIKWPIDTNPGRFRAATATALPLRDNSVDVVVTDPPYYQMIDYSDASDVLYVWVRRALYNAQSDLLGPGAPELQPKGEEIIVKNGGAAGEHRTADFYHQKLAEAFSEMKRVLKPGGSLTVIFGHHDPDAWVRLLSALRDAGFVVTGAWPSRTESANTGVASVKVTVSIVCHVAPDKRPAGLVADVDREVRQAVEARARQWNEQGLAQSDQNMAAYGPAMEAYGAYSQVTFPSEKPVDLERYLILARRVVREQLALKVDTIPLDAFDPATRLAVYWLRYYGQDAVAKGESRYLAQTEGVRLEDVRDIFDESRKGFTLSLTPAPVEITPTTPVFSVVLGLAFALKSGGVDAASEVLGLAVNTGIIESPTDSRLWAIISDIPQRIPQGSELAKALATIQRTQNQLNAMSQNHATIGSDRGSQGQIEWSADT